MQSPEAGLVRKSFTIKKMDLPPSVQLTKRSLLRWFALSFGLVSEQESRATVLNVLDALFHFLLYKKQNPSTLDIQDYIDSKYKRKVSEKLLRYHLNKLIAIELLQRKSNRYFLNNSPYSEPNNLQESFNFWVKQPVNSAMDDIVSVLAKLSESYKK
ncbi:MAG: hypothetical protein JW744_01410 [Candidatus Diapherotrites archaeon]|uniref:Uncharacterized protein n=1 Tax=Candidatus Iainarchaeum sp. TaxID=3101447 RepID=A0A938YMV6_9ARCH|nr:hypothetical protein [Candidatus Diapherotrites archaeon]